MKTLQRKFSPIQGIIAALLAGTVVTIAGCGGSDDPVAVDISVLTAAGAGTGTGAGRGPAPVVLGGAGDYVILAESGITNVPTSAITGKIGLSAATGASITGLDDCSEIVGQVVHTVDNTGPVCRTVVPLILTPAIGAKNTAYTDAAGRAPDYTELGAGNIGGRNLGPATYKWSSALLIPTNVTLTGGPNDVWIFQIAQGMTVASGAQIILAGGALPQNVYWQTFSAEFNTTSQIKGTVLSQTSIAMKSGASITGRLFAGTATTLIQNVVTAPL